MTKRQRKENIKWLVLVGIVGAAAAGIGYSLRPMPKPVEITPKPTFALDSRLEALADEIGLNKAWLVEARAEVKPGGYCGGNARACYATSGSFGYIYVEEDALANPAQNKEAIAWEYLRFARQFKMSAADRQLGDNLVRQFYARNEAAIDRRLAPEPGSHDINTDIYLESVHSMACSATSDAKLGAELTSYCNKWVRTAALPDDLK